MNIYINNTLIKSEILPNNTPTLDETLETFSFALISNTTPLPYTPMQSVKVDFLGDETDVAYFLIVSDSVETYSLNPLRYKHNISCIQNTRALSKHLVRNSVFTQPAWKSKSSFNAESGYADTYSSGATISWNTAQIPSLNWASEKLTLDSKEKIKTSKLKFNFQYVINQYNTSAREIYEDADSVSDILTRATVINDLAVDTTLTLQYTLNGSTVTESITPSDLGLSVFPLKGEYIFSRVKELADEGANDFEILFDSLNYLTGTYKTGEAQTVPNLSFYMVQIEIVAETYYWTAYDILNLLLERQKKETSINSSTALFSLPTSGDLYDLLQNTIAPNFIFTQLTMYECVAEVFRLFDAIFTMDEDGVLGIEYFNDLSNEEVTPTLTGRTLALGEDKFTNGLVAYYQDGRIEETFPNKDNFAYLRSSEFGVPEAQDHHFIVPHNIQSIIKCEILLDAYVGNDGAWEVTGPISVDITRHVLESSIWSLLDVGTLSNSDWENRTIKQTNSIYFEPGDNKIQVAFSFKSSWNITHYSLFYAVWMALLRMSGTDEQSYFEPSATYEGKWYDIQMRLTYNATVDGKTKIHSLTNKYEGETLVDQDNGAVDLNKFGLNILGLSLKLGNPTLNATHKITSWSDRIKTGQLYEYQGGLWIANVVNYTFFGGYIQGKVSFVQNFNQLALRTQLLREKRMSNISSQLTQKSEEIITDFVYYYGSRTPVRQYEGETIHFKSTPFLELITASFYDNNTSYDIQCAGQIIADDSDFIYIPMIRYGAGNTINFEMSYEHPISAGHQTTATSGWVGNKNYYTTSVNYADDDGFLDTITIKAGLTFTYTRTFPNGVMNTGDGYFTIENYNVYKQPNEIFALNYQLAFLPVDETTDFLGNEFINNNAFIHSPELGKKCYICFKEEKSSVLDNKASSYFLKREITSVSSSVSDYSYMLTFTYTAITTAQIEQTESWAIVDENENVLFASNTKPNYLAVYIHFFTKLNRLS